MTAVFGLLAALMSCDGLDRRTLIQDQPAVTMTPWSGAHDGGPGRVDSGGGDTGDGRLSTSDGGDAYLVMCRHYCDALAETGLYFCAASNCSGQPPGSDLCFRDRCTPRRVQPTECLIQCDALDRQYRAYCGNDDASQRDTGLCPSPPDAHDAACRAGCALVADGAAMLDTLKKYLAAG